MIRDNPFGAKRVVRWLLNTASGLPNDGLRYAWTEGISDDPLLTVNIIEPGCGRRTRGHAKAWLIG